MKQSIITVIFSIALAITAFGQNNGTVYHQVKQGETLYSISRTYSVSVDEIKQWNQLSSNNISVGQTLVIGSSASNSSVGESDQSGQQLKTYSGTFESGTATYQYYENENYERIFQGTFEYKQKNSFKEITIIGRYKNNKKDGKWTATLIDHTNWTNTRGYEMKGVAIGNYSNGKLEGLCTYTNTNITNNKLLAKSSATFANNTPIGNYQYWVKDDENDLSVDLPLNSKGLADGTVTVKYKNNGKQLEHIRKYKDGYMTFELHRDMTTGEVLSKFDNEKFIDEIYSTYDSSLKVSIIPYIEFEQNKDENPIYKNLPKGLAKYKSYGIAYYENAPFTYRRTGIGGDYGSFWDLYIAIDFWQNGDCQYCGSRDNPLFFYDKGAEVVDFSPEKALVLDENMYENYVTETTITKNKKYRAALLDSLKLAVISSIDWIPLKENLLISSIPITKSHSIGYKYDAPNQVGKYTDSYYEREHNSEFHNRNEKLKAIITSIRERKDAYIEGEVFSNEPGGFSDNKAQEVATWLGFRIASDEEVKYAKDKGLIKPLSSNIDFKVFYFVNQK